MATNITIARLNTVVTANAAQFSKELDRASAVAKTRGRSINSALSTIGVGLSVGAVIAYGKSVIDLAGNIQDLSMQADLTPRGLQAIANAGMDSSVSMEDVARASEKMRSKLQDAKTNAADPLNASLRKLGLSAEGLAALTMEQKWEVVAQRLVTAKNQQEAMNIASDIFGEKIGPRMRETLQRLAGGMEAAARSAQGLTISNDQLEKLDAAGDRLGRLGKMLKVLGANMITGTSFQKDWAAIRAGFGLPEQEDPNIAALRTPAPREDLNAKMLKAQQEAWDKSMKEYKQKQDAIMRGYAFKKQVERENPFYDLEQRKKKDEWRDKVSELYTARNPDLVAFSRDLQRSPIEASLNAVPTDQMSKIGLMSNNINPQANPEEKKQTEHLRMISETLKLINQAVRTGTVAQPSKAIFAN